MPDSNKPEYVIDLENKVNNLEAKFDKLELKVDKLETGLKEVKHNQDESFSIQRETLSKLNQIKICLEGTEFDKQEANGHGGGIVKRLSRNEKKTDELEIWKTKTVTRDKIVYGAITAAIGFISTVIISNWSNIFNK